MGTPFKFLDILEAEGGPPHIPFEGIWLNVQTRLRTPNKIQICLRSSWGGWSEANDNAMLWLHLASWNLQDSQLGLESKIEPSVPIM